MLCVEGGVTACVCVCGGGRKRCVVDTCNVSLNNPDLGWWWVGLCRLHVHVTIIAHNIIGKFSIIMHV